MNVTEVERAATMVEQATRARSAAATEVERKDTLSVILAARRWLNNAERRAWQPAARGLLAAHKATDDEHSFGL